MKKIVIVAGETSADLYAANLVTALRKETRDISFSGLGGPKMRAAGVELLCNLTEYASTGLDPLSHFSAFARIFRQLVAQMQREKPDLVVLLDFPDFNLRLAREVKKLSIPLVYYISPQVWAWRPGRIKTIARLVNQMLVIFEFEKELYQRHNVPVEFVGHPLLDAIEEVRISKSEARRQLGIKPARTTVRSGGEDGLVIGLLPGSREAEFRRHFPIMQQAGKLIQERMAQSNSPDFILACAPAITPQFLEPYAQNSPIRFHSYFNQTRQVMQASDLLITSSGTATIESAIFGTPMVVIYRVSWLTALVLGPLIKTPYYAMANIVAQDKVVPELMQREATPERIAEEVCSLMEENHLARMADALAVVRQKLGSPGASHRAAQIILKMLGRGQVHP